MVWGIIVFFLFQEKNLFVCFVLICLVKVNQNKKKGTKEGKGFICHLFRINQTNNFKSIFQSDRKIIRIIKKELFNKITLVLRNEVVWEYELRMGPETSLVLYNNVVSNLFLVFFSC